MGPVFLTSIWTSTREKLTSLFLTKLDSNQHVQLYGLVRNLACSMIHFYHFWRVNNRCADQTARRRRLVCAFSVLYVNKTGFFVLVTKLIFN